jgi:4-alpha-glucanotransferase
VIDLPRSSGVQLHLTSLPEGRLGPGAYRFVDWLAAAGQTWWQVLPLGPPDRYRSPYKAKSAFAAWPGLLADRRAFVSPSEVLEFREREAFWAGDWEAFAGRGALADQVRFSREWNALRSYASSAGVRLFGDVAIYVAPGSADHRAHPALFRSGLVAGAPPDAYSSVGQLWGNPLYDWPALRRRRYRWWVERLRQTMALFDLARIDHFRGFVSYWAVPAGARNAASGCWQRGPVVAEDLGVITPAVARLRDSLGFPGMVVLQFGFDPADLASVHRFENHERWRVVYTGTHDHDTARGWYSSLDASTRALVDAEVERVGVREREPWWSLIRLALASRAQVAMMQAQDVLGLGSEGRMNAPGRVANAWRWRMEAGALTPALARRLRDATEAAGRLVA